MRSPTRYRVRRMMLATGLIGVLSAGGCPAPLEVHIDNCPTTVVTVGTTVTLALSTPNAGGQANVAYLTTILDDSPVEVEGADGAQPIVRILDLGSITLMVSAESGPSTGTAMCTFSADGCAADEQCADADACNGTEQCDAGVCRPGQPPECPDDMACDPTDGSCRCMSDAACDDGDLCNGVERCDNDGQCVGGEPPCSDDDDACTLEFCDPATGACTVFTTACDSGFVCDPQDGLCDCTTDDACDDGLFCNGAETCENGDCQAGPPPCDDTPCPVCDEAAGACNTPECCNDADCDDGLFCTGAETCQDGACQPGGDPCAVFCCDEGLSCEEGADQAVCSCPGMTGGQSLEFTIAQDQLTGTLCDDTFSAPLEFHPGGLSETFQTGDVADGLGGMDTVSATLNSAMEVVPTLISVETVILTTFGNGDPADDQVTTLNAANSSGVESITSQNSTDDVVIADLQAYVDVGLRGIADPNVDLTAAFADPETTAGTTDELSLTIRDSTAGVVTVTPAAANGFEILTVTTAEGPNTLVHLLETGTTLHTVRFDGEADLQIMQLPDSVRTLDASNLTGGLTLGAGDTSTDYVPFADGDLDDIAGGSGNDRLILGTTLNGDDASGPDRFIDLAAGSDALQATFAESIATPLPLRNIEALFFNVSAGVTLDLDGVSGLQTLTVDADGSSNVLTLLNAPAPQQLCFRGDGDATAQVYDGLTATFEPADSLRIDVHNRGAAGAHALGLLELAGPASVRLSVVDGPAALAGLMLPSTSSLECLAPQDLSLGTVSADNAATLLQVDCSAVGGALSATFEALGPGAVVHLGPGHDNVSLAGSAGSTIALTTAGGNDVVIGSKQGDIINSGSGNDDITPGQGLDTVSSGSGADVVSLVGLISSADRNDIVDFSALGGDVLRFDAATFTDYSAGGALIIRSAATITDSAGPDNQIIIDSAANIATINTTAGNGSNPLAIATDSGQVIYDADGNYGSGNAIIAGIPAAQVNSLTAANFEVVE